MDARAYKVKTTRRAFAHALEAYRALADSGADMPAGAQALYDAAADWFAVLVKKGQREELGENRRSKQGGIHACIRTIVGPTRCGCPICAEPWAHDPRFEAGDTPAIVVEVHHADAARARRMVLESNDADELRALRRAETVGGLHRPGLLRAIDERLVELGGADFDRVAALEHAASLVDAPDPIETEAPGLFDGPMVAELAPDPEPVDGPTRHTWVDGEPTRRFGGRRRRLDVPGMPSVEDAAAWRVAYFSHEEAEWAGFGIERATGRRVLCRVAYSRANGVYRLLVNGEARRMELGAKVRPEALYSDPTPLADAAARCGIDPWQHHHGRPRIGVIGCSATKAGEPGKARDVYKATALQGLRYCEAAGLVAVFCSAQHGTVETDQPLEPYDAAPPRGNVGRGTWGVRFLETLERLGYLRDGVELEWHAGEAYARGAELAQLRASTGPDLSQQEKRIASIPDPSLSTRMSAVSNSQPLMGMAIGRRRAWYRERMAILEDRA
jgi:hypothetical protein